MYLLSMLGPELHKGGSKAEDTSGQKVSQSGERRSCLTKGMQEEKQLQLLNQPELVKHHETGNTKRRQKHPSEYQYNGK